MGGAKGGSLRLRADFYIASAHMGPACVKGWGEGQMLGTAEQLAGREREQVHPIAAFKTTSAHIGPAWLTAVQRTVR